MNLLLIINLCLVAGFIRFSKIITRKIKNIKMSTLVCCYEDNYENDNGRKKIYNKEIFIEMNPIYTIIWYDCIKCKELLNDMKTMNIPFEYINLDYYFYDEDQEYAYNNRPIFYRNDVFIGDDLFDIYPYIYPM